MLAAATCLISWLGLFAPRAAADDPKPGREAVVVLHGLGRTSFSMRGMANHLESAGFVVANVGYSSRSGPPAELVDVIRDQIRKDLGDPEAYDSIHFVTHSLGGILVRALLADQAPASLGRVVMLAPPNKGSEVVDQLGDYRFFRGLMGPTAVELGTAHDALPKRLPAPTYELGVIAGNRSIEPWLSWLIPGDDDGKVSIESTKIDGMTDFRVVDSTHTFIMNSAVVRDEVLHFLRHGRFREVRG